MSSSPSDPVTPSGAERDAAAEQRDAEAARRDRAATERDSLAGERDDHGDSRRGTTDADASADRAAAGRDRQASAADRQDASADRQAAKADRSSSADERAATVVDGLTGAHRRDPGLLELEREIVRAKRTGRPFTLAFIDVNGLKIKNDTEGHAAGDRLLVIVAERIRSAIREYDLLVRYGGDEFLCGLLAVGREDAAKRFGDATAAIAGEPMFFSFGLAELGPEDGLPDLIARADADMYRQRQQP
jgi:diguanylate cyclase (GGDEF)-like protein